MQTTEIREYVTPKDRQTICAIYRVSDSYIKKILAGRRDTKSQLALRIKKDLEIMANINFLAELAKQEELQAA